MQHNHHRLASINTYSRELLEWDYPLSDKIHFGVDGTLTGDINWNSISARITINVPISLDKQKPSFQASCSIKPFTGNCGIKTIESIVQFKSPYCLKYIESFLYYCCNCTYLIGSDYIDLNRPSEGNTGRTIKLYGSGYTFTDSVWNQNYYSCKDHKIFLFHKHLNEECGFVNYWG